VGGEKTVRQLFIDFRKAYDSVIKQKKNKQTPWPLVRERTIPTDRPPLFDEI
jgi:hypothetical protein